MTSNDPTKKQIEIETGPKSEKLDMIANFMDTILTNMKTHIQTIQKNKTNDSFANSPDFQNILTEAQKSLLEAKAPPKPEVPTPSESPSANPESSKCVEAHHSQIKNPQNKNKNLNSRASKSRTPSIIQSTQKKYVPNNNATKQTISRNSNIRQNSSIRNNLNNKPNVQQTASPRKMLVVYKENDNFVSRSLTTMLKETNAPQISTVSSNSIKNKPASANIRRRTNSPNTKLNTGRSKSLSKPVNTTHNPLQQTTAGHNHMRPKSITSNTSKSTASTVKHGSVKSGSDNKKSTSNVSPKEIMEKHIRRNSCMLRPMSTSCEHQTTIGNNNRTTVSLNSKPVTQASNKSPVKKNRINSANQTCKERPPQKYKVQTEIKKAQNTKQIEIINRINFQNGKESVEYIKQIQVPALPAQPKIPGTESTPITPIPQIIASKPSTPLKFMKNTENTRIKLTEAKDKQPAKSDKEDVQEKTENKTDDTNQGQLNEMEDSSITEINDKIQQLIHKMKEENEPNTEETTCPESSSQQPEIKEEKETSQNNSKPSTPSQPTQPIIAKASTQNKQVILQNNNNNKKQQSKQSINNQNKKPSSSIFNKSLMKRASGNNSTSIIPINPNFYCIPPYRKLSVHTPVEIVQDFVNLVNKAKRERKTFTVCGNYFSVRRAFIDRGWVEKLRVNLIDDKEAWKKLENLSNFELVEGMKDRANGDKYRRILISKLLAGHQVDFYWDYMSNPFTVNNDRIKRTLINRLPFGASRSYTSKAGLSESLKEAYWYYIEGYSNILFPRTYNVAYDDEINAFTEDFRRTAIISLLQWIARNADKPTCIISPEGQIPTSVYNFASLQCHNILKCKEHKDIDEVIPMAKEYEWDIFLEKYYKIVHQGNHFKETDNITAPILIEQAIYILNKLRKYFPQMDYDGNMNLWLLKPNTGSRGCGIHVCRTLSYILDVINARKDRKYVIQKYIERPLLIHNTKFDIRQWFMITCMPNLQVWLYKDCYLRFSSQIYDLSKLHESIHLTNNSIQCRYLNNRNRSHDLPEQNMWHSDTFRKYLSDIGQPYVWKNTIYKGIKECLIGLFMICQDKLLTRVNSFELCGADFMLGEDYRPYLIEINSRPALYPSTRITAKMCPKVLEDVVRVTVDYARNPRASTGQFELIYKDTFSYIPPKSINSLFIEGISYKLFGEEPTSKQVTSKLTEMASENNDNTGAIQNILKIDPHKVRKEVKNTLEKLLAIIHTEQQKTGDKSTDEKNKQFRMMLSEFVDKISTVKNKSD